MNLSRANSIITKSVNKKSVRPQVFRVQRYAQYNDNQFETKISLKESLLVEYN